MKFKPSFLVAVVLLLIVAVYLPGLHSGFLFDDYPNILDNTALDIPSLTPTELWHAMLSSNAGPLKRPVAMLTVTLNHYFYGLNPQAYIVTNITIHLLAALAVFVFTWLVAKTLNRQRDMPITPFHFALIVMLIWGLHPYNLTSVLYIIQRMTSLAGLFSLLALAIYAFYRTRLDRDGKLPRSPLQGKRNLKWRFPKHLFLMIFGVTVTFLLAIFSKENALLLPIQLAVLEFTIFANVEKTPVYWLKLRKWMLILGGTAIAIFALKTLLMTDWVTSYAARDFTLGERVWTEQRILFVYLRQIVLPDITSMGLLLDDMPISHGLFSPITTVLALIFHLTLIFAALRYRTKQPVFSFAVLWFYSSHLLESTVFPLELMFEHRNYLAMFGPIIAIVYYALLVTRTQKQRRIAYSFLYCFIGLLGISTATRASYFGDPAAYTLYEAEHHPHSSRSNFNAGRTMTQTMLADMGNKEFYFAKAISYYHKAKQAENPRIEPFIAELQTWLAAGKPIDPSFIVSLQEKLKSIPPGNDGYYIAQGLLSIGQLGYPNRVTKEQLDGIFVSALANPGLQGDSRGHLLIARSIAYCNYYKICDKAIPLAEEAVKTAPSHTEFKVMLASLYGQVGDKANQQKWIAIAEDADKLKYFSGQIRLLKSGVIITWGPQLPNQQPNDQTQPHPTSQK
ncbi:MAG: hypothetical protein LBV44_08080 [Methylobacillus sp.]|jgi:hypothetical protein|nr:hypothetical protein [Methylobacillus sp.]